LNIHGRWSGRDNYRGIVCRAVIIKSGGIIRRTITERSEATEAKTSNAKAPKGWSETPSWSPHGPCMGMMMSFPMMSLISPSIYILMCMMMAVSFVMTLAFGSIMSRMAVLSAFIAVIICVIMAVPSVVKSHIIPIKPQRRLAENQPEQNYCKAGKK
jgi:hypothetical protein